MSTRPGELPDVSPCTSKWKFNSPKIGALVSTVIYIFTTLLLNGVNFENMFGIYKKYGFWTWDMNAFFLIIPSAMWIPVAFFFSFKNLGVKLTKFSRQYMDIDAELSGTGELGS